MGLCAPSSSILSILGQAKPTPNGRIKAGLERGGESNAASCCISAKRIPYGLTVCNSTADVLAAQSALPT
jgi:hypothetical protein